MYLSAAAKACCDAIAVSEFCALMFQLDLKRVLVRLLRQPLRSSAQPQGLADEKIVHVIRVLVDDGRFLNCVGDCQRCRVPGGQGEAMTWEIDSSASAGISPSDTCYTCNALYFLLSLDNLYISLRIASRESSASELGVYNRFGRPMNR